MMSTQRYEDDEIDSMHPIKPKKKQIIAIFGIVGLMMGIFLAFWFEFWEKGIKLREIAR